MKSVVATQQENAGVARIDMKLEVVVIPVSDVDRALITIEPCDSKTLRLLTSLQTCNHFAPSWANVPQVSNARPGPPACLSQQNI